MDSFKATGGVTTNPSSLMRENNASRTAIVVAKSQALVGSTPGLRHQVNPEADQFTKTVLRSAGQHRFLNWLHRPALRNALWRFQNLTIPGLALHQVLRKRYIEERTRSALESGVEEVIQIGAGLDSLCFRLHRQWPDVRFREFDHPATQALKRRAIELHGGAGDNFTMHSTDLCRPESVADFGELLADLPRIIIVEGVLMYLSPEQVAALFRSWSQLPGDQSTLLFTYMDDFGFRDQSSLVNAWLRLVGEPFRWQTKREELAILLKKAGWTPPALKATWLDNSGEDRIAEGEWIAETEVSKTFSPLSIHADSV